jgi:multimeric flavodoxin WrbA
MWGGDDMPNVIGICGSERLNGNTQQFIQTALDTISEYNIDTELITLADKNIKGGCTGCVWCRSNRAECNIKDDFMPIWEKMYEADGIIVGSPVYWGSATAKMKAVLERAGTVSEGRELDNLDGPVKDLGWPVEEKPPGLFYGKVGGAISTTRRTGANFTLAELLMWFIINNFVVVGSSYWTIGVGTKRIAKETKKGKKGSTHTMNMIETDLEGAWTMKHFGENFAHVVKKLAR